MKIATENPARSGKYEKLIHGLRRKMCDYGADLEKAECELAKAWGKVGLECRRTCEVHSVVEGKV